MIITSLTWNWMLVVDIFKILLPIISESFQKQDHTFFLQPMYQAKAYPRIEATYSL